MLDDILPRLVDIKYLILEGVSSGCHNLKLDDILSYLTTVLHPFGMYQYIGLPFGSVLAGDMFQRKIDELFSSIPKVLGIADDILIVDFDEQGKDNNELLEKVLIQVVKPKP